jgi:hypothetical protein
LNDNGVLVLEHSLQHQRATITDPFGITINNLIEIIPKWTDGKYKIAYVFDTEANQISSRKSNILCIGRIDYG